MRDADNIREVERLAGMMGFIFWPGSKRYVSRKPAYLPVRCKRVGVFVDEAPEHVRQTAEEYALDYIQLHGHESPEYCAALKGFRIIKAFRLATLADLDIVKDYAGSCDLFLFDAKGALPGGNGERFDWSLTCCYDGTTPFLLSGGIGPDDAERLCTFSHPRCVGIDINSRFEREPGIKDTEMLRKFLNKVKSMSSSPDNSVTSSPYSENIQPLQPEGIVES